MSAPAHRVGHVVLAGGFRRARRSRRIKDGGAQVLCFAPALVLARKLVRMGADAIVIEGSEAGGHIGPVSTSVLAQEILPHLTEVPVFVAGGIGRGEAIARPISKWARPACSSARASSAPQNRSRIRASSRPSSAPRRATRCRRCSSIRAFR